MNLSLNNTDYNETLKAVTSLAVGQSHGILTDIYQEDINIVVWQRNLTAALQHAVSGIIDANHSLEVKTSVKPQEALLTTAKELGSTAGAYLLGENIAEIVDMFCCLFDLKKAGLRLALLDKAMCPRFHVDRVPCRLVTTYGGAATEWLPNDIVDRSKLGTANLKTPDDQTGLFNSSKDICYLSEGDVSLLKGELWQGNEGAGLIHRSPHLSKGQKRLFVSLDFIAE